MASKQKSEFYVNKKEMYDEVVKCRETGVISRKLADMMTLMTERIIRKQNYIRYSYKEDMQAYALMMLVKTWKGFNPEKSNDPFAYYTTCIDNSYVQFLNKEKRHRDIRDKLLVENGFDPSYTYTEEEESRLRSTQTRDDEEDFDTLTQESLAIKQSMKQAENNQLDNSD